MDSVGSQGQRSDAHVRRRLTAAIRDSLRETRNQLSVLNHQISEQLEVRDVDLDCLDLVARHGPLSPSALARRSGLHPATLTGILDRLERAGFAARERDPSDRRGVVVRALRDRGAEVLGLYAGMNASLDEICARYNEEELKAIADFLQRAAEAGQRAAAELSDA